MDPRFFTRKGYDTDLLVLRSLFALNPMTNQPISSLFMLTTDGIGGLNWYSALNYISASLAIPNLPSSLNSLSSGLSTTTGRFNNFSSIYSTNLQSFLANSISTITISSQSLAASTITLIDTANNANNILQVNSGSLLLNGSAIVPGSGINQAQLVSTVAGLGTARYISSSQLTSTAAFLYNPNTYISTGNLFSTTESLLNYAQNFNVGDGISSFVVYGTANFYSTVSIGVYNLYIQDVSTLSSAVGIEIENLSSLVNNTSNYFSSFLGDNQGGFVTSTQLFSTFEGLGEAGYLSTPSLTSTVQGLGNAGYISSFQLISTVQGLGTAGYISSSQLQSTVIGLGGTGLVSTGQLTSTVSGLGTAGYISSFQLISTVQNLGQAGYISSSQLQSTVIGLGGTGIISTGQLTSTVLGLGTAGYVSSLQLLSVSQFLYSTGTYISSGNLVSTTRGLLGSFQVVNSGDIYVTGGTLNVTTANNIIMLSSFLNSTIAYSGNNGQITSLQNNASLYFSSANLRLDSFSSYIGAKSLVTIDVSPTYLFDKLAYTLSDWNANALKVPQRIFMSSFVQFGATGNYFSSQMYETMFFPTNYDSNTSNIVNQPFRIQLTGQELINTYSQSPYRLGHFLPNGYSLGNTNGFSNSNVTIFIGSTNSIFYSVQNLP